MTVHRDTGLCG